MRQLGVRYCACICLYQVMHVVISHKTIHYSVEPVMPASISLSSCWNMDLLDDKLGSEGSLKFWRFGSFAFIPTLVPISFKAQGKLLLEMIDGRLSSIRLRGVAVSPCKSVLTKWALILLPPFLLIDCCGTRVLLFPSVFLKWASSAIWCSLLDESGPVFSTILKNFEVESCSRLYGLSNSLNLPFLSSYEEEINYLDEQYQLVYLSLPWFYQNPW